MRTLYTSVSSASLYEFVRLLEKKNNWHADVIISNGTIIENIAKRNTKSLILDSMKLRQNEFTYTDKLKFYPVDKEILNRLSKYESTFLSWLEDTNTHNFSFNQRRYFYQDSLNFSNSLINSYKPELFFSFTWPHVISDYALYLLCKYIYKIPVLFFDIIPFLDKPNHLIFTSYEDMSEVIMKYKNTVINQDIENSCTKYFSQMRMEPNKVFIHNYLKRWYKKNSFSLHKNFFKDIITFFKILLTFSLFKKAPLAFKKNTKPFGKKSLLTNFDALIFKYKLLCKTLINSISYELKTKKTLPKKYLYYPAPFQPEAATCLAQGKYENQFIILDMLKETIPNDIKVVYKEHPGTFHGFSKGSLYKNSEYYERLKKYNFLEFTSFKSNSIDLIDNSIGVLSSSSTAGWEAVTRDKPCILFGSIWYQSCSEIFKVENLNQMKNALKKIIYEKFTPNRENIEQFFKTAIASTVFFPSKDNKTIEFGDHLSQSCSKLKEIFNKIYLETETDKNKIPK